MPRKNLIDRLPSIWRRLDTEGFLERYLSVWDFELDAVHRKIIELLSIRNIDKLPDKWVDLLADLVGHNWRKNRTHTWNRRRIQNSIRRHSYKGTILRVEDTVNELSGEGCNIQDNASKLLVLGKQGRLSMSDAYIVAPDYWHDGAFLLEYPNSIPLNDLMFELGDTLPAAERWYFLTRYIIPAVFEVVSSIRWSGGHVSSGAEWGKIGYGQLGVDECSILSYEPNGAVLRQYRPIDWTSLHEPYPGYRSIGEDLHLSFEPNGSVYKKYWPVLWHTSEFPRDVLGESIVGTDLSLSFQSAGYVCFLDYLYQYGICGSSFTVDSPVPVNSDIPVNLVELPEEYSFDQQKYVITTID